MPNPPEKSIARSTFRKRPAPQESEEPEELGSPAHLTEAERYRRNLIRQRGSPLQDYDQAASDRDGLTTALHCLSTTAATGTRTPRPSPAPDTQKSAKMPDAPILDNGKIVKFQDWKNAIRTKLLQNDDHYPTIAHKLAYTYSRCKGKALRHVNPRMRPEVTGAYKSVDICKHLEGVFHDLNYTQVARDQYLELNMNPRQDFTDFLAEFTYLTEESEQPEQLRKRDLYRKLPTLLQN
ncbi:uncharacterized protein N7482_010763 [Penicillium canariense]|uniref:Uncharacterized protein n=1 Tax=Penicillium canariense TaxID=189055 RepID=A0A9W9HL91_9EURO|nr:uncharacterized protein N7482_010763 [Penicillium canariense]KAJ5151511.1 hypothetical protein N7482_010763 [Penicillium canariense]